MDICSLPGAAIDIGVCRFRPDEAGANLHFALLLSEVTGRLEPSGAGGYCEKGVEAGWLRLADIEAGALEAIVRRVQRMYPSWRLHADDALPIHGRIQVHFNTAQERWRRERSG